MALSVSKLPWYGQVGAFVALSAMAAGAFYYFYESDVRAEMAVRQGRLDQLHAEVVKARSLAGRLPEFRAQVTELESRLESLKAVLPEQKDVGDLLRRIQTLATQSNLEIRGFKPQAISTKQLHAEWPIALELDGTYHDLGIFFDKVSKVPRIINISNVDIKGKDRDRRPPRPGDPVDPTTITASCLATTFVLMENPAPPAAKGPAKGKPAAPGVSPAAAAAAAKPAR
jgi:type IV pilus assembly protein PilO